MNKPTKILISGILIVGFAIPAFTQSTIITTLIPPYPGDPTKFLNGAQQWTVPAGSGGGGGFAGAVSNNVASAGLLAVDTSKTNGIAATFAHMTNALGVAVSQAELAALQGATGPIQAQIDTVSPWLETNSNVILKGAQSGFTFSNHVFIVDQNPYPNVTTTVTGGGDGQTYNYLIVANFSDGTRSTADFSPSFGGTTDGPALLDATHYIELSWDTLPYATNYTVYAVTRFDPSTTGVIATVTNLVFRDDGALAVGSVVYPGSVIGRISTGRIQLPEIGTLEIVKNDLSIAASIYETGIEAPAFYGSSFGNGNGSAPGSSFNIGSGSGQASVYSGSQNIYNFGSSGSFAAITNCASLYNYGLMSGQTAICSNSFFCFNYGDEAGSNQKLYDSSWIFNFGFQSGAAAELTNAVDIFSIGNNSNFELKGDGLSHIFVVGSGVTATNSNDWIAGDSNYNYRFPGASFRTASGIAAGSTNQWKTGEAAISLTVTASVTNAVVATINGRKVYLLIANETPP